MRVPWLRVQDISEIEPSSSRNKALKQVSFWVQRLRKGDQAEARSTTAWKKLSRESSGKSGFEFGRQQAYDCGSSPVGSTRRFFVPIRPSRLSSGNPIAPIPWEWPLSNRCYQSRPILHRISWQRSWPTKPTPIGRNALHIHNPGILTAVSDKLIASSSEYRCT